MNRYVIKAVTKFYIYVYPMSSTVLFMFLLDAKFQFTGHWAISCSSQCSTTGVTKAMVCAILSVDVAYKRTLAVISEKVAHVVAAGFLSRYLSGPLPYVRRHVTVNKMCWVRR